jgi:hypothetical protein
MRLPKLRSRPLWECHDGRPSHESARGIGDREKIAGEWFEQCCHRFGRKLWFLVTRDAQADPV